MNRNQESHFSRVPTMSHPRSCMDRSCGHTTSFNAGKLIPIYCEDVLPGDTISMSTSVLARLQTMLTPAFGNIYLDTYWFFVPNRLCWDKWKEFMGENVSSHWYPTQEYRMPICPPPAWRSSAASKGDSELTPVSWPKGSVADYLGANVLEPTGIRGAWTTSGNYWVPDNYVGLPSKLPFAAYCLIWNDFFRDQNLQDPVLVLDTPTDHGIGLNQFGADIDKAITKAMETWSTAYYGLSTLPAAKFHDYFTSALPAPQKGPAVSVPLNIAGQSIPVLAGRVHNQYVHNPNYADGRPTPLVFAQWDTLASPSKLELDAQLMPNTGLSDTTPTTQGLFSVRGITNGFPDATKDVWSTSPANLWAYIDQTDFGLNINTLRLATVTQMYYEALARGGSRYEEQIQQFFGVRNPDSRIQHPEYLGGTRMRINVREVINTSQSSTDFLGDVGAQSVSAGTHSDFTKSFTEHGWLLGFAVVRYDHSYNQGMPRKFTRYGKFDYYNPLFARIGEQPLFDYEIYNDSAARGDGTPTVFGYQEAWAPYRYAIDQVSGELRPDLNSGLGHWTLSDNYASKPILSSNWIIEDKGNLDRVLAVTSTLSDQVFADFYFSTKWTRPMPMYSVPGAIGQF